jgi:hypothetical protein
VSTDAVRKLASVSDDEQREHELGDELEFPPREDPPEERSHLAARIADREAGRERGDVEAELEGEAPGEQRAGDGGDDEAA